MDLSFRNCNEQQPKNARRQKYGHHSTLMTIWLLAELSQKWTLCRSGQSLRQELNMNITMETTVEGYLIFLDLALVWGPVYVCWKYQPRAKKGIPPFSSAHSKLVKWGDANNRLNGPLEKSRLHAIKQSSGHQVAKLKPRDYFDAVVRSKTEMLFKQIYTVRLNSSKRKPGQWPSPTLTRCVTQLNKIC